MKVSSIAVAITSQILCIVWQEASSFTVVVSSRNKHGGSQKLQMATGGGGGGVDNSNAMIMGDYLAKAHEAKLEAIRMVEEAKNAEIKALKEELQKIKASQKSQPAPEAPVETTTPSTSTLQGSTEDILGQLMAYRRFMADYIVKSHEEKNQAIKAAESAVEAKWRAKFDDLSSAPAALSSSSQTSSPPPTPSFSDDYLRRNEHMKLAAASGVSRWGSQELSKIGAADVPLTSLLAVPPVLATPEEMNDSILAADHGLRNDGGVGGPSLAERVILGAKATQQSLSSSSSSPSESLYSRRNVKVEAAAKAGMSRWGDLEVGKVSSLTTNGAEAATAATPTAETTAQIQAADHGLRNDGGVGGPSLAERVILGAKATQRAMTTTASPESDSLYSQRNRHVAAAAKAGVSRWGDLELEKVSKLVVEQPKTNGASLTTNGVVKVERKNGASLQERVNLGAKLVFH